MLQINLVLKKNESKNGSPNWIAEVIYLESESFHEK